MPSNFDKDNEKVVLSHLIIKLGKSEIPFKIYLSRWYFRHCINDLWKNGQWESTDSYLWVSFCQPDTKLDLPGKKEPQLQNLLHQTDSKQFSWLLIDIEGPSLLGWYNPVQVLGRGVRKGFWNNPVSSSPQWSPFSSCSGVLTGFPCGWVCEPSKPSPPQAAFSAVSQQQEQAWPPLSEKVPRRTWSGSWDV